MRHAVLLVCLALCVVSVTAADSNQSDVKASLSNIEAAAASVSGHHLEVRPGLRFNILLLLEPVDEAESACAANRNCVLTCRLATSGRWWKIRSRTMPLLEVAAMLLTRQPTCMHMPQQ
jgi:hypothetical protein